MSTKAESFEKSKPMMPIMRDRMLQTMREMEPHALSRSDLSKLCGMRLASVCAISNRLLKEKRIKVAGTKYDTETRRNVEALALAN